MKREKVIVWSPHYYEWDSNANIFVQENENEYTQEPEYYDDAEENNIPAKMRGMFAIPIAKKMMQTPFGVYDVDDALNPYKIFRFWMGNANFDIDEYNAELLENTEGVEVLKILSPYRFIVAIGDAFSVNDVRLDIQNRLCHDPGKLSKLESEIEAVKTQLNVYKHWAIYCFPNGKIDYCFARDDSELDIFNSKLSTYIESQKLSKGKLITSNAVGVKNVD